MWPTGRMVSNPGGVTAAHGGCPARISAGPTAPAPVPAGFGSRDAGRGGRLIAGSPSRHGGADVLPEPYQRRHRDVARHAYRVGGHVAEVEPEQACALFSHLPSADGYRYEDVTTEVAACDPPLPLDGDYVGPAAIVGYTVVFAGGVPSHAIAICDTPQGRRTVVRSEDQALLESMTREEFCGRVVQVTGAAFGP